MAHAECPGCQERDHLIEELRESLEIVTRYCEWLRCDAEAWQAREEMLAKFEGECG